jgi:hypothetical protein
MSKEISTDDHGDRRVFTVKNKDLMTMYKYAMQHCPHFRDIRPVWTVEGEMLLDEVRIFFSDDALESEISMFLLKWS